jgi:hypothetical protein
VYTNYQPEFDFSSRSTYFLPDKIIKITGNAIDDDNLPEFVDEPYNTQILNIIESNMNELGYTKVTDAQTADLLLFPASWTNTTIYYWYDYWCWYYPWYCGGYGWGYPSVSSYTTGTLVMTLADQKDEYIEPYMAWGGAVNGLLSGAYNIGRIEKGIDQAFIQSPYLKKN